MKSHRTLMHFSGIAAICFSGFMLLSIISQLIGLKFQFLPVGKLSPDEVVYIYQNSGFGIGVFLRFVAYVLLPLAFCGLVPHLYAKTPCLVRTGVVYGAVAYLFFLTVTFIEAGMVVSGGGGVLTKPDKTICAYRFFCFAGGFRGVVWNIIYFVWEAGFFWVLLF